MGNSSPRTLRQRLKELVGAEFVFFEFNELRHFRVDGVLPRAVAAPADAEQLAGLVDFLGKEGLSMAGRGGGTGLSQGQPPSRLDVLILTLRLDRIQEPDPQNSAVAVGAGIRLDELEHRLAGWNQRLPLNPPSTDLATLGGMIACNAAGPWRIRHGTMRERSLGIKLVNARGEIISTRESPGPNLAGLDLTRLLIGSLGTLGIMFEATVRLEPRPAKLQALLAAFPTLASALAGAEGILGLGETPAFLELVGPEAIQRMNPLPEGVALPRDQFVLAAAAEGGKDRVAELIEAYRADLSRSGAETIADLDHGIEWELDYILQELYAETEGILIQVSVPKANLAPLFNRVSALNADRGIRIGRMAHAGSGVAHLVLQPALDQGWPSQLPQVAADLADLAADLAGSLAVLSAPTAVKAQLPSLGLDGAEAEGRRRLKQEWDPHNLFNPGRLFQT